MHRGFLSGICTTEEASEFRCRNTYDDGVDENYTVNQDDFVLVQFELPIFYEINKSVHSPVEHAD